MYPSGTETARSLRASQFPYVFLGYPGAFWGKLL